MDGFQAMRRATPNSEVLRQAESGIRDSQKRIAYYEDTLMQLQSKRQQQQRTSSSAGSTSGPGSGGFDGSTTHGSTTSGGFPRDSSASYNSSAPSFNSSRHSTADSDRPLPGIPGGGPPIPGGGAFDDPRRAGSPGPGAYGPPGAMGYNPYTQQQGGGMPPGAMRPMQGGPYGQQAPWLQGSAINRMGTTTGKKNYTNLDLIKFDTPLTTAKISRMLQILEFKLQTEKQYMNAVDKMAKLYQAEGDRKSKADAESKRVESNSKIVLLQLSLKKYKQLHIMDDEEDEETGGFRT